MKVGDARRSAAAAQPQPYTRGALQEVVLLVMELATGGELFDFMMYTGCFPEPIARTYFQQLLQGAGRRSRTPATP